MLFLTCLSFHSFHLQQIHLLTIIVITTAGRGNSWLQANIKITCVMEDTHLVTAHKLPALLEITDFPFSIRLCYNTLLGKLFLLQLHTFDINTSEAEGVICNNHKNSE